MSVFTELNAPSLPPWEWKTHAGWGISDSEAVFYYARPRYESSFSPGFRMHQVSIPVWLLAVFCLAWPVTSFLVRRRRRGRGFAVETKTAGDPVTASGS